MKGTKPLKNNSNSNLTSSNIRNSNMGYSSGSNPQQLMGSNQRSQNLDQLSSMSKNLVDKRSNDGSQSQTLPKKKIINNKNMELNKPKGAEEDYIQNLQKTVYYLELEMKLMKDREIDTKNKVGGYEILFRDGVPLNEHFLALKTKYTKEKSTFEDLVEHMKEEISHVEKNNEDCKVEIDRTNKNYYDMIESYSKNADFYEKKINELNSKLINENNLIDSYVDEKVAVGKELYNYNGRNIHFKRTIEKEKLFKENRDDKKKKIIEKNIEKFNAVDQLCARSLLEEEEIVRKIEGNQKLKVLEEANTRMIFQINKAEREVHLATAKISELDSIKTLNHKYLLDEELVLRLQQIENAKLNEDLDNLGKLNDEALKKKVKENEKNQIILINNKIKNQELEMNYLLEKYKDEEAKAKDFLEDKNTLQGRILALVEDIANQEEKIKDLRIHKVEVKNQINEFEILLDDSKVVDENLLNENARMKAQNTKLEEDTKVLLNNIEEINQKIELNAILNDIDINELKLLTQNNAVVQNSINTLMSKWDKVNSKLAEMEVKSKNKEEI